ncbi:hypothetical protein AVEN_235619-1 [Araneus ventricosus]|uniref:Uncharacterized protein n=1 Tax=Araneus ventricosus TaxID=182803 RepID=A0A4Y2BSC3_ARAVE|nr:hypothetical protein AVEN_235619-1 [Araneus ventricosus]
MVNLWLLIIISGGLLACDLIWTVSNYGSSDQPQICACECSSESMTFPEMTSYAHYKGLTRNASSCTCEDFLAPKLHRYVLANHNETCGLCKCSVAFDTECEDGYPTFFAQFHTATVAAMLLTFGLGLVNGVAYCCYYHGQRSQKRNGYQMIGNSEIAQKQPSASSNLELSKRIEQLFNENMALKLKFKMLEKKVSNIKIPQYSRA